MQTQAGKDGRDQWKDIPESRYWALVDPETVKKDRKSAYARRNIRPDDVSADKKSPEFYEEEFEKRAKKAF